MDRRSFINLLPAFLSLPYSRRPNNQENDLKREADRFMREYNVRFEGTWTGELFYFLKNLAERLPKDMFTSNPFGQLYIVTKDYDGDVANTSHEAVSLHLLYSNENFPPAIWLSPSQLTSQETFDETFIHELLHIKCWELYAVSNKKDINEIYHDIQKGENIVTWYEDVLKDYVLNGTSFENFCQTAHETLNKRYRGHIQNIRGIIINNNHQTNPYPLRNLNGVYRDVERWLYAINATLEEGISEIRRPIEFVSVLGTWYIEGREVFMEKAIMAVDEKQAEKIYNFLKTYMFSHYEYRDKQLISTNTRNEITKRGRS